MKIKEIQPGAKRISVVATVASKSEPRNVTTRFGPGQVADVVLTDETGSITLSVWNEKIATVTVGAKVLVENAMADSYQGKNQLKLGKFGKLGPA